MLQLANGATGPGQLRLYEDTDNGTNFTALQVGTQSGDITYTLPTADGSSGTRLTTNGSGTLSWAASNVPSSADGQALGSASAEWSDLFLADGGVINLGADQDTTLTHVADTGILLNSTRQLQFGDSGTYIHQSADGVLDLVSDTEIEINATTIDINGAVQISGTTTIAGNLVFGSATVTEAQLEILDGATVTTTELNIIDGGTSATSTTVADADRVVFNDGGTMKQVAVTDLAAYFDDEITSMPNLTTAAALVTVSALDTGSITSGFGNIDNGASNITSGGLVKLDVDADADDVTGDSATGRLTLGAGQDLNLYHGGTNSYIVNDTGDLILKTGASDEDMIFQGNDGGSAITALTLDMSAAGAATFNSTVAATGFIIGSANIGEAELEILDGLAATTAELTVIDGDTSATGTTVADADRVVMNDNGTMVQVAVTDLAAYFDDEITAMPNLVTTAATTVGALNSGSIATGFGAIDNGTSNITTGGLISIDADTDANDNTADGSAGRLAIGASGDLTLYHNTNSYIVNKTGNLVLHTETDDSDIVFTGEDGSSGITALTLDMSEGGRAEFNASIRLITDGNALQFGAGQDVTLTHVHDTGLLLNSSSRLQFGDSGTYIHQSADGVLDLVSDTEIELNATTLDINANVEISGTATTTGVHTFTAVPVFPNNTVESADIQADAITGAKIADDAINSEHYTDGSIDTAHIADDQVTLAKMAGGTDGNLITYDASGDPAYVATGSDGQVLTSTGAGSAPAFEALPGTGKILQSVFVQNATDVAFPQNTTLNTTIVSAAITPTATNSKIIIHWSYRGEMNGGSYPAVSLALSRTISGSATGLQYMYYLGYQGNDSGHRMLHHPGFYQDTHNTTSEITYYLYGGNNTGSSFSGTYGGHANGNNNKSEILIMEIGV